MTDLVPFSDISRMAMAIAKSGFFGMKTADQAVALMLIAQAEGRHPAMAARDYDIIQGRPAKKAEAMLRDFLQAGGRVEWHELTDTCARATFSHSSGGKIPIDWDMARATKAGLHTKDMYKKFPRQMLRSRCISEGVRTVYPAATSGMYAPEEAIDIPPTLDVAGAVDVTDTLTQFVQGQDLLADARSAALHGLQFLRDYWVGLSTDQRRELMPYHDELQAAAEKADAEPEAVGR